MYNEYVIKDRSTKNIAEEYGCKQNTIQQWLAKHKIKKDVKKTPRVEKYKYQNKDFLYHEHIINSKSMSQIAKENNISQDTVRYYLQKHNIDYWQMTPRNTYTDKDKTRIIDLYVNQNMSANQISILYNTSHNVILRILRNEGITTRDYREAQFATNNKEYNELFDDANYLNHLHWEENKSCKEIGELLGGYEAGTVRRHMQQLGLKTKTNSESKIGLMIGEKHPNWKGGITPLNLLLREYFHTNQVPKIAKRDNYTCQLCGAKHTVLNVHHIYEFSKIIDDIMAEHPELDCNITEDRLKLYQIITNDNRFLDENNLITFCKDCHYFKIHNYKRHKTISSQAS